MIVKVQTSRLYLNRLARICGPLVLIDSRRSLLTLAIETSCDDTSVALVEKHHDRSLAGGSSPAASIRFHEKIISNNLAYRGIHPIVALDSHQQSLAKLVRRAFPLLPEWDRKGCNVPLNIMHGNTQLIKRKPDFISVTRGPGMRSNLSTGLDTAKGLAIAWDVPLVGVNHMQAHALTPRLVSGLDGTIGEPATPKFPFFTLLVSGGHTMLIHSKSLNNHPILASTLDIAIGDAIDKIARSILPEDVLDSATSTMYGPMLEAFAFPNGEADYHYRAPRNRQEELERKITRWGWSIGIPFAASSSGSRTKEMVYSFSGLCSHASRIVQESPRTFEIEERRTLAREAMRVAFEHLASRIVLALAGNTASAQVLVVSGGVAANMYLRLVYVVFMMHSYNVLILVGSASFLMLAVSRRFNWSSHHSISVQTMPP